MCDVTLKLCNINQWIADFGWVAQPPAPKMIEMINELTDATHTLTWRQLLPRYAAV